MRGVKRDKTHPVEDVLLDPVDDRLLDLVVGAVAPPGEDVRLREDVLGEAVLGFV